MRYSRPRIIAATVLGLAGCLAFAGCSSTQSGPTSAAAGASSASASSPAASPSVGSRVVGACSLVTEADATIALGVDPGPGIEVTQSPTSGCTFGASPSMVSVHLSPAGKAEYDQMRAAPVQGATMVDLSGIGDAAFGIFQRPVASIGFYRGDSYVSIVIYADGSQDRAVALAKAAAGRL